MIHRIVDVNHLKLQLGEYHIRPYADQDVAALVKYANNRNVWLNLRDGFPHPYTEDAAHAWLRHVKTRDPQTAFAIADDRELVGGIGVELQADVHRCSAELGYWLGEPFWGRGIMTAAVLAFTEHAFVTYNVIRLFASVFEWNTASARVLEKAGFTLEGRLRQSAIKDGKLIDTLLYAKLRES